MVPGRAITGSVALVNVVSVARVNTLVVDTPGGSTRGAKGARRQNHVDLLHDETPSRTNAASEHSTAASLT